MNKSAAINKYAGQVMNALISRGFYDVRISRCEYDDYALIDMTQYPQVRFSQIKIYKDGIAHCSERYGSNTVDFEMRITSKREIIDCLTK